MEMIEDVLDNFDFGKVHKVMEFLDWKWALDNQVPSYYALIKTAKKLLEEAVEKRTVIGTGGFRASYKDGVLSLEFVVTTWECEEEENE